MEFHGHTPMGDELLDHEFEWKEADPDLIKGLSEKIHAAKT